MKKQMPKVSILTSCYNGEDYIQNYAKCLLNQNYRPLECVIVNDGSEDNSSKLLDELAEQANAHGIETHIIHQGNQGLAAGISRAAYMSTGDYLICWDIDDFFFDNNIEILAHTLNNNPDCDAVLANGYYVHAENMHEQPRTFLESHSGFKPNNIFECLLSGDAWNWPGSYMIKSSVLNKTYGERKIVIPRSWKNMQNLQLLLPAAYNGIIFCDRNVMKYYFHSESLSHRNPSYYNDLKRIKAYEDIRLQLLDIMGIHQEPFIGIVSTSFAKIKLDLAFRHNKKDDFLFLYNSIKREKKLSSEDLLLKSKICNDSKLRQFIYKCIHKINILFFS